MKINYDNMMMNIINSLTEKKSILLHSCCGPCSSACIDRLKEYFDITVVYYNPNIEPIDEYIHRKNEQVRLLKEWDVKYLDCDYDNDLWVDITKYLTNELEGGKRCSVCFGIRLKYTANMAKRLGFDYFGTTLTVSPHKDSQLINKIGGILGTNLGIKYLYSDFKKRDGYKKSCEFAKQYNLYRQDYCGCLYSKERDEKYEEYMKEGVEVENPENMLNIEFDYIVVAVEKENTFQSIYQEIISNGWDKGKPILGSISRFK